MEIYNKLVRDKIPEIMKNKGEKAVTRILPHESYLSELDKKLNEEFREYQESKDIEELADIIEVIYSISEAKGCSVDELHKIRELKKQQRGGFKDRIFLISKE